MDTSKIKKRTSREDNDWVRKRPEKMRDATLLEWDQDNAEDVIADGCLEILNEKTKINIRGLIDELGRRVHLTKRGEAVAPKVFVQEVGGTKIWLQRLCEKRQAQLQVIGIWPNVSLTRRQDVSPPKIQPCLGVTVRGKCIFWDKRKGYGKLITDDTGVKVFAHCRDILNAKSLPRGAPLRFVIVHDDRHQPKSSADTPRYAARAILIDTNLLASSSSSLNNTSTSSAMDETEDYAPR